MQKIVLGAIMVALSCAPAGGGQDPGGMQVDGGTLKQLVEDVQHQTGKNFLYEDQVDANLSQKKMHVHASELPKNAEDYFALFESIPQLNDLVLVPIGKPGSET
ncbi:MAG: hypothetical protein HYY16_04765 [Planctomycetes bacterium]|nr:hypothetical protein [Planctomycetota bacterium]